MRKEDYKWWGMSRISYRRKVRVGIFRVEENEGMIQIMMKMRAK